MTDDLGGGSYDSGASRAATTDLSARLGTSALGGTDAAIATLAIDPGICRTAGRGALVLPSTYPHPRSGPPIQSRQASESSSD